MRTPGWAWALLLLFWASGAVVAGQKASGKTLPLLVDFSADGALDLVETESAAVSLADGALRVKGADTDGDVEVTVRAATKQWRLKGIDQEDADKAAFRRAEGRWDVSRHRSLMVNVTNRSGRPLVLECEMVSPTAKFKKRALSRSLELKGGGKGALNIPLPILVTYDKKGNLIEFDGKDDRTKGIKVPDWKKKIDPFNVTALVFRVKGPARHVDFELRRLRLAEPNVLRHPDGSLLKGADASGRSGGAALIGFDTASARRHVETTSALVAVEAGELRVTGKDGSGAVRVTVRAPEGRWDVSRHKRLTMDVTNRSDRPLRLECELISPTAVYKKRALSRALELEPGARGALEVPLPILVTYGKDGKIIEWKGMRTAPSGQSEQRWMKKIDVGNVTGLLFRADGPPSDVSFALSRIRLTEENVFSPPGAGRIFPFVDEFGQYEFRDWPGKTKSVDDMRARIAVEDADLLEHARPEDFNEYGGWKTGPQLEATGAFRTARHSGKWWLVDPEGRLFFSHGICAVRVDGEETALTGREKYFSHLPDRSDDRYRAFYETYTVDGRTNPREVLGFAFNTYNLLRKYGEEWKAVAVERAHRRLRSWGYNTLGNWTKPEVYESGGLPYTVAVHYRAPSVLSITGRPALWFPDIYHPQWEAAMREGLEQRLGKSASDPWCIGYFIDNELHWEDDVVPRATLQGPAEQPAKIAFLDLLQRKYGAIDRLNAAWGAEHASWEELAAQREAPDRARARADYDAFVAMTAERYYSTVARAVRNLAPEKLYLGSRMNSVVREPSLAAARHCDIVSYNLYWSAQQVRSHEFPSGADAPLMVGEWHFCATDRGHFDQGLKAARNQQERAAHYINYIKACLEQPAFVGAHWFRYQDQMITGRVLDGANCQNGLIDICDSPHVITVAAARETGRNIYRYRMRSDWR